MLDLNAEAAEVVAAAIRAEGGRAVAIPCDTTRRASDDANFITGQVLSVSGGLTMNG